MSDGLTNARIGRELWVTEQTVKFHLSNIYRKLGVSNRTEASRYAYTHGLLRRVSTPAAPAATEAELASVSELRPVTRRRRRLSPKLNRITAKGGPRARPSYVLAAPDGTARRCPARTA